MSTASAKIDLNISEGMIANAISLAIAESFSDEKKDQVIRDIVRAHLSYKANSYDRDTMLSKAIGDTIRQVASEAVKARIAELAPEIRRVVDKALGPKFTDGVLAQLETAVQRLAIANITIDARAVVTDD